MQISLIIYYFKKACIGESKSGEKNQLLLKGKILSLIWAVKKIAHRGTKIAHWGHIAAKQGFSKKNQNCHFPIEYFSLIENFRKSYDQPFFCVA